jgi:hypothetical protein
MIVTAIDTTGNSSKFRVISKKAEFTMAISFTLRTKIWVLADAEAELSAANELAQAIISRHDPSLPFKSLYIFAEHNSEPSLGETIQKIRKHGFGGQAL